MLESHSSTVLSVNGAIIGYRIRWELAQAIGNLRLQALCSSHIKLVGQVTLLQTAMAFVVTPTSSKAFVGSKQATVAPRRAAPVVSIFSGLWS